MQCFATDPQLNQSVPASLFERGSRGPQLAFSGRKSKLKVNIGVNRAFALQKLITEIVLQGDAR